MQNERDEQVIFIKDLIFAALYQWRKILILALVFATLLGGYKVASELPLSQSGSEETVAETPEVATLKEDVRRRTEYLETSLLMNLNPYAVYKATLTVSAMAEDISATPATQPVSYVGAVLKSYTSIITSILSTPEAAEIAGTNVHSLVELVSVTYETHNAADGSITVTISHSDAAVAEALMDLLEKELPSITEQIGSSVATHTVKTQRNGTTVVDRELQTRQNMEKEALNKLRTSLEAASASSAPAAGGVTSYGALLKGGILFAIIGSILGAGMVVCVIWVAHFCSTKVYSARTLKAWTGIKVLGCVGTSRKNPIDRWLRKLEGRSDEKQLAVAAATVRNYATDQTLLVCADAGCPEDTLKTLVEKIPAAQVCGSLNEDVAALEKLPKCGNVLLVVSCGKTLYRDVSRQMQLVQDQKKYLIGCVVLDG